MKTNLPFLKQALYFCRNSKCHALTETINSSIYLVGKSCKAVERSNDHNSNLKTRIQTSLAP